MSRLLTMMSLQWGDLPLEELFPLVKSMGYEGIELGTVSNHLDLKRAYEDDSYVQYVKDLLDKNGLKCEALCTHVISQCVGDDADPRLNNFAPAELADKPEEIRAWATEYMKYAAVVAKKLGASVVTGFLGSPIWKYMYSFPQTTEAMIEEGFQKIHDRWAPILDVFEREGIKFAHEVHPAEIAFDYYSTQRMLEKMSDYPCCGINFDPSHLIWQGMKPELFIRDFADKIYHVHIKDAAVTLDGRSSILGSHIDFGSAKRGWNFRSPGHGDVNFEEIIRALNDIDYQGPLSVEWEDSGMDRVYGATDAAQFVKKIDFAPSTFAFDDAIANEA